MTTYPSAPADTQEEWRPLPGYVGLYEVSSHGRVRSLDRVVTSKAGWTKAFKGAIKATPRNVQGGYPIVTLSADGVSTTRQVHVAVAAAFIGPRPEGMQVAHGDGDPSNNRAENLRYATPSENEADKLRHGTNPWANRTHCPQGHEYTPENIKQEGPLRNHRKCRECAKARGREYAASGKRRARRKPVETEALQIRRWAASQGIEVAQTGRLSRSLREQYYLNP